MANATGTSQAIINTLSGKRVASAHFVGHFERQFDCHIRVLRTDGGGENANIDLFCERTGIARQRTKTDNPASNGKAERMHRKVLNMAHCMIFNCRLHMHFWGDAVKCAAYVLNRSPCKANPRRSSPIEMLKGKPPNLTHIVTFGSSCIDYRKSGKNSLKKRSQRGLILGISEEVKGCRVYLMDHKKVVTTQHVKCIQTLSHAQNLMLLEPTRATIESSNRVNNSFVDVEDTDPATGLAADSPVGGELQHPTPALIERATTRQADKRKPSQRIRDIMASFIQALEDDEDEAIICNAMATCIDPPNYNAAMSTAAADRWNIAIEEELKSLRDNRTWVVVDKPHDVKPLASRFVFKSKRDSDKAVERYKARLVARGDQQIVGINYMTRFHQLWV